MEFCGKWNIYEIDSRNTDSYGLDEQAYIYIDSDNSGIIQFGLICGDLDGRIRNNPNEKIYEFMLDGNEGFDDVTGRGWLKLTDKNTVSGKLLIDDGDVTDFLAKRSIPA